MSIPALFFLLVLVMGIPLLITIILILREDM